MAQSTVNLQKMKSVSVELEKIRGNMDGTKKKLDELMLSLPKVWRGEGSEAYQKAYQENSRNFQLLAQAIGSCAEALTASHSTYSKADTAAAELIKSKMSKL